MPNSYINSNEFFITQVHTELEGSCDCEECDDGASVADAMVSLALHLLLALHVYQFDASDKSLGCGVGNADT